MPAALGHLLMKQHLHDVYEHHILPHFQSLKPCPVKSTLDAYMLLLCDKPDTTV